MRKFIQHRFGGLILFLLVFLAIATATRVALLARAWHEIDRSPSALLGVIFCGLTFDLAAGVYAGIPAFAYLLVAPRAWLAHRVHRWLSVAFLFVFHARPSF